MQKQHEAVLVEKEYQYSELDNRSNHRVSELQKTLLSYEQQFDDLNAE
jgi:hypothetical protein